MPSIIRPVGREAASLRGRSVSESGAISAAAENDMAWGRSSVTFRLTAERRQALLSLAPELGMRASPTAALDLAIERATGMGACSTWSRDFHSVDKQAEMLSELRAVLDACVALQADAANVKAGLDQVERGVAELRLAAVPSALPSTVELCHASDPTPLGRWLDQQVGADRSWAIVKARWIDARSDGTGLAKLTADAWIAAPPDLATRSTSAQAKIFGPVKLGTLAAFDDGAVCVLACARTDGGWLARLHALDVAGQLGPELDSFSA